MKIIDNTDKSTDLAEDKSKYYIECISLIGTKMYFTIYLLPVFLKQIDIWVIFTSFIILMAVLDPTNILQRGSFSALLYVWSCMAVIYLGLTISMLAIWYLFLRSKQVRSVIVPINSFAVVCALILLYPYIEMPVLGDLATLPASVHIKDSLYFFAIEQVFITLYISIGFPLTVRNLGLEDAYPGGYFTANPKKSKILQPEEHATIQQEAAAPPNQPAIQMQIGAQSFNVKDICCVSAEEHYVRVKTDAKEWLIRDKFSQVVARFQDGLGFQVHRSHWVAFSCVQEVVRYDTQYKIQLDNGELIPISKARKQKFQENLLLYRA